MKIVHIIAGLGDGGAEGVLYRLCTNDSSGNEHIVISLTDAGKYGALLNESGIRVLCLDCGRGRLGIFSLLKIYSFLKKERPDAVQTWMYHADLAGGVVAKIAGVKKIYWNIRHTDLNNEYSKKSTYYVAKACALLSRIVPTRIICCAVKSKETHVKIGYQSSKIEVIGNGYDLNKFYPSNNSSEELRSAFSIPKEIPLLGMVARYDPLKDHDNLLRALSLVKKSIQFKFLLVGTGLTADNLELSSMIGTMGLEKNCILLGPRSDIPNIMRALDIHVLSSKSEGFPNVLAEAMASGTPCVATNVGDAALIVQNNGLIVPPKNEEALASAIIEMIGQSKNTLLWDAKKKEAREIILNNFEINKMVKKYHRVWFS